MKIVHFGPVDSSSDSGQVISITWPLRIPSRWPEALIQVPERRGFAVGKERRLGRSEIRVSTLPKVPVRVGLGHDGRNVIFLGKAEAWSLSSLTLILPTQHPKSCLLQHRTEQENSFIT